MTAASLDNTGSIYLNGSGANQALLDVTAGSAGFGAAGVLSGNVQLCGDSAIEFTSGQITSMAAGRLVLNGNDAFIEDSTALGSNSALTGLVQRRGQPLSRKRGLAVDAPAPLAKTEPAIYQFEGGLLPRGGADQQRLSIWRLALGDKTCIRDSITSWTAAATNQALLDVTTGAAGFGTAGTSERLLFN